MYTKDLSSKHLLFSSLLAMGLTSGIAGCKLESRITFVEVDPRPFLFLMWQARRGGQPTVEAGIPTGVACQAAWKSKQEADVTVE